MCMALYLYEGERYILKVYTADNVVVIVFGSLYWYPGGHVAWPFAVANTCVCVRYLGKECEQVISTGKCNAFQYLHQYRF